MSEAGAHAVLVGRDRELSLLAKSARAAAASGATLLLVGEPGVGKTALLEAAARMSAVEGGRVVRCGGVEYQTDVSFAGLHQLLGPLVEDAAQLPASMRMTLDVALGTGPSPAPERLAVMNATLELFRLASARQPLLVLVDDMQWLDRATGAVIGFVGRRVGGTHMAARSGPSSGGRVLRACRTPHGSRGPTRRA